MIGDKVVDALEGKLEPEFKEKWTWSSESESESDGSMNENFMGTEDGSRSGPKGLRLLEELAKGNKGKRSSVL